MVLIKKPTAFGTTPQRHTPPNEWKPMVGGGLRDKIKHAKIMVVDDDPLLANGVARIIRDMGCEVVTTDGMRAFDEFIKGGFDLVISDLDMPFVNGTDLIKKIKAVAPSARIIIYTANDSVEDSELLDAGAIEVLHKPVEAQTLKNCISKNLI